MAPNSRAMSTVLSVEPVSAITICSTIDRTLPRQARRSSPPFFTIIESPTVANRHLHQGWKHVYTQISRRSLDSSKEHIRMRLKPAFADELPDSLRMSIFTSARRDYGAPPAYTK